MASEQESEAGVYRRRRYEAGSRPSGARAVTIPAGAASRGREKFASANLLVTIPDINRTYALSANLVPILA